MLRQLDPNTRFPQLTEDVKSNPEKMHKIYKKCSFQGMDQAFHNYLLHSGQFSKYIDVKMFLQGEGPVNNVGSFYPGPMAIIKHSLAEWNVLRGSAPNQTFHNWNGDLSPVVHQYDRFL